MADMSVMLARVRGALGDLGERFRVTFPGGQDEYETGYQRITEVVVSKVSGSVVMDLAEGTDYTLEPVDGIVTLTTALETTDTLMVAGKAFSLFTDEEITGYITDAVRRHTHERETSQRVRDDHGFIRIERTPITLANLPEIELEPLTVLATIEALWDMTTDASSDVDVWTAEGTHLSRGQRFQQLTAQREALQARYEDFCRQLNIGMNRIEVGTLRRVSYLTGRLVPVFAPREYDEYSPKGPRRLLPPVDAPNEDPSELPSPNWGGWGP
ncbi:hypothetical protein [Microbispora sp. NPDC049633]|uniref:hypothetical protein n=1 Tax=Microbispora sp. NPDC049633 TaxID=3154355 RepID=UPI003413C0E0